MSVQPVALPEAVLLAGPTCAGKTALALELAARFPVEIVSVDSAQVYRGMDVGTSKPSPAVRAQVPHHLIDICDPAERYSAGRFRRDALPLRKLVGGQPAMGSVIAPAVRLAFMEQRARRHLAVGANALPHVPRISGVV